MKRLVNKIYVDFNALNGCPIPAPEEFYVANDEHASIENLQYVQKALKKLYEYEKLEQQEMLIKLPCKVGDKIYEIKNNYIYEFNAKKIEIRKENEEYIFRIDGGDYKLDNFGKTVFLTQEDALEELKRMEEK